MTEPVNAAAIIEVLKELAPKALTLRVDAVEGVVADRADVIRSKEDAGRPKDLRVLPALYRFDRQRRSGDQPR